MLITNNSLKGINTENFKSRYPFSNSQKAHSEKNGDKVKIYIESSKKVLNVLKQHKLSKISLDLLIVNSQKPPASYVTSEVHLRDEFASAGSLSGVFKPYQILYIAILIKSISFNHALTADLPFHAISAWENEPSLSTNCVSGIPLTMLIIRE